MVKMGLKFSMRSVQPGWVVFGLVALWGSLEARAQSFDPACLTEKTVSGIVAASGSLMKFQLENGDQSYFSEGLQIGSPKLSITSLAKKEVMLVVNIVATPDRYNRLPAHIIVDPNGRATWLQARLLAEGQSILSGQYDKSACMNSLIEFEDAARLSLTGHWKSSWLPMRATDVETLQNSAGEFSLVEGKVRSIGDRTKRLYLNFGQNWSQDFTVIVAKTGRNAFKGNWERFRHLADKKVRIRGMLEMNSGPLIRLVYEGQLEIGD